MVFARSCHLPHLFRETFRRNGGFVPEGAPELLLMCVNLLFRVFEGKAFRLVVERQTEDGFGSSGFQTDLRVGSFRFARRERKKGDRSENIGIGVDLVCGRRCAQWHGSGPFRSEEIAHSQRVRAGDFFADYNKVPVQKAVDTGFYPDAIAVNGDGFGRAVFQMQRLGPVDDRSLCCGNLFEEPEGDQRSIPFFIPDARPPDSAADVVVEVLLRGGISAIIAEH